MLLPIIAALAGFYLIGVVVAALRGGTIRYRRAHHVRANEPKTFWLKDACLDRGGSWNAEGGTCGGPVLAPPPN